MRRQSWAGLTPQQILQRYRPGKAPPLEVLEVLLELFNALHTSLEKTVSHKTRHERAQFLRRLLRDLHEKAGFKKLPGLNVDEYQRHESAQRDRSWSAQGVDIDALIAEVNAYDRHVGASLRLIRTLGLRRKESVQFRPFESVMSFADTGLPAEEKAADRYVRVKGKGGRVCWIPLDNPARLAALEVAQAVVGSRDAHMGDPSRDLKRNLRRFDYVMEKFGITVRERGATGHGLRHEVLIDVYQEVTGEPPPVRGGGPVPTEVDRAARQAVSRLAGHARTRAAGAYFTHRDVFAPDEPRDTEGAWPMAVSVGVLVGATVLVAMEAEAVSAALEATAASLGLSDIFVGVIVLALIGTASDLVAAVWFARRGKVGLALSICVGSSIHVGLVVVPLLVIASWVLGKPITLVFSDPLDLFAIAGTAFIVNAIASDGEATWFEGVLLIGVYALLGMAFFFVDRPA